MRLYDSAIAPNPRRLRFFLAEKGIDIPKVDVDIRGGENLQPDYLALNPFGLVPVLQLDDGTALSEVPAICRYLEALHPEPNLMGTTPVETAQIEAWERFAEMQGMQAAGEVFRNGAPAFSGRGMAGPALLEQIPALIDRGKLRVAAYYEQLEKRLGESQYLAGDRFTLADITAAIAVDFAGLTKLGIPDGHPNTVRWHAAISARPAASA